MHGLRTADNNFTIYFRNHKLRSHKSIHVLHHKLGLFYLGSHSKTKQTSKSKKLLISKKRIGTIKLPKQDKDGGNEFYYI